MTLSARFQRPAMAISGLSAIAPCVLALYMAGIFAATAAGARVTLSIKGMQLRREYPTMRDCEAARERVLATRDRTRPERRGDFRVECRPRIY